MRGRAIVMTTTTTMAALAGLGWQSAAAAGDENTDLAESQFAAYLATHTTLVPLDVTCAPLPDAAPTGPMICYALVNNRQTVAALAELESPGLYHFIAINKVEVGAAAATGTASVSRADAAILDLLGSVTSTDSRLPAMLMQANPDIVSVDTVSFFDATGTLEIGVTTTAADADVRNAIAFVVTDVASGLWAEGQPLRDSAATIRPRLEVTVDGTLYSSAYEMMTSIADGTMTYTDWLGLTGVGESTASERFDRRFSQRFDPRAVVKRHR